MSRKAVVIAKVLVVVVVVLLIGGFAVLAVNYIHNWRIKNNESEAVKTLRTLVTQENLWHKQDVDGNGTNDYWAIDVAGLCRVLRQPEGVEAAMIDIAIAESDWSPDGRGDGAGGEFPIIAVPFVAGKQVPGLAAMAHAKPVPCSGYYVAAFRNDAKGAPYAADMDDAGQAYENTSRFAFMAFPEEYDGTGRRAFIVEAAGIIWQIDAVTGGFSSSVGPIPTPVGVPPLDKWPGTGETPAYGND